MEFPGSRLFPQMMDGKIKFLVLCLILEGCWVPVIGESLDYEEILDSLPQARAQSSVFSKGTRDDIRAKVSHSCDCRENFCTCCENVQVNGTQNCVDVEIIPKRDSEDNLKRFSWSMLKPNLESKAEPAGLSPGPFCVHISPTLGISGCLEFSRIYFHNLVLNTCIKLRLIVASNAITELAIECFKFKIFPDSRKNPTNPPNSDPTPPPPAPPENEPEDPKDEEKKKFGYWW